MGYMFNQHASLASFSLYFLLFGQDFKLPASIQCDAMTVISFDDSPMWVHTCGQQVALFRWVMLMAMENLAITQH
jgi:hypothetical protein